MNASRIGFYGKLPAHGDFISRGLPRAFINPWDEWLQGVLANSRELLGADWLDRYLVSPLWRFALAPGICGADGWRGLLLPSVDSVNRYFPLTVASPESRGVSPLGALVLDTQWFAACEEAALAALQPGLEADALAARLAEIDVEPAQRLRVPCPRFGTDGASAWHFDLPSDEPDLPLDTVLAEALLHIAYPRCSLWWAAGSEHVPPSLLIHRGLPSMHDFAALLDGRWAQWGWASCRVETDTGDGTANGA